MKFNRYIYIGIFTAVVTVFILPLFMPITTLWQFILISLSLLVTWLSSTTQMLKKRRQS